MSVVLKINIDSVRNFILLLVFFVNFITIAGEEAKSDYSSLPDIELNIKSFGAIGDGSTLSTEMIQSAIDSAYKSNGGTIIIPDGVFLCGSIVIRSGVELHLLEGATLLGSTNPAHYKKLKDHVALILSDNSDNITISGKGIINGQGLDLALVIDSLHHTGNVIDPNYNYRRMRPSESVRPQIINFSECSDIKVKNVTIKNGAGWVTKYKQCHSLVIDSVKIISMAYWNNDGMDICDCKNVRITNCFVNTADDGICFKSYSHEYFNDSIYVANCKIRSSASAIKFGTDSRGGFTNIKIEKIKVYDTYRSAIAIESVDGGIIENIEISEIEAKNTGNAIFIRLGHRNVEEPVGSVKNITIKDIKAIIPFDRPDNDYDLRGPDLPFFHNTFPSSITGIPEYNVENVSLENIEIIYPGRATKGMAYAALYKLNKIPENEKEYPEFSMFGELPAWGFYVRHVNGIKMKNIVLHVNENDYRPAFVFDDVKDISLINTDVFIRDNHKQIVLNNVSQGEFEKIRINENIEYDILQLGNCNSLKIN